MSQKPSIQNPHLRPSPEYDPGLLQQYFGPGWYVNTNFGWIKCIGMDKDGTNPPDNAGNAQWFQTRKDAEKSLVRTNITTEGGKRKRGYSRRRRGDKRKSRRGSKKRKLKMRG